MGGCLFLSLNYIHANMYEQRKNNMDYKMKIVKLLQVVWEYSICIRRTGKISRRIPLKFILKNFISEREICFHVNIYGYCEQNPNSWCNVFVYKTFSSTLGCGLSHLYKICQYTIHLFNKAILKHSMFSLFICLYNLMFGLVSSILMDSNEKSSGWLNGKWGRNVPISLAHWKSRKGEMKS